MWRASLLRRHAGIGVMCICSTHIQPPGSPLHNIFCLKLKHAIGSLINNAVELLINHKEDPSDRHRTEQEHSIHIVVPRLDQRRRGGTRKWHGGSRIRGNRTVRKHSGLYWQHKEHEPRGRGVLNRYVAEELSPKSQTAHRSRSTGGAQRCKVLHLQAGEHQSNEGT